MKVLALNSSPNKSRGATALMLGPFLDGMRKEGAEVTEIYVSDLNIRPCSGCFTCWVATPGRCKYRDDMDTIYERLSAEVLVLATPLYVDGMTGTLKVLLDRVIPTCEPWVVLKDGRCRHPVRQQARAGKMALVSVCGFHETENFDPLVQHVKAIAKNFDREFVGAILRPYAGALTSIRKAGLPVDDIFSAAHEAGRQLILKGEIDGDLLQTVSREVVSQDACVEGLNENFRRAIESVKKRGLTSL